MTTEHLYPNHEAAGKAYTRSEEICSLLQIKVVQFKIHDALILSYREGYEAGRQAVIQELGSVWKDVEKAKVGTKP